MLCTFKSRSLRAYWENNDEAGIRPDWLKKTRIILDALHAATAPEELNLPGFGFHPLKGDRAGIYSVKVSRNWRITFRWDGYDAIDVDLEDYHGG